MTRSVASVISTPEDETDFYQQPWNGCSQLASFSTSLRLNNVSFVELYEDGLHQAVVHKGLSQTSLQYYTKAYFYVSKGSSVFFLVKWLES